MNSYDKVFDDAIKIIDEIQIILDDITEWCDTETKKIEKAKIIKEEYKKRIEKIANIDN